MYELGLVTFQRWLKKPLGNGLSPQNKPIHMCVEPLFQRLEFVEDIVGSDQCLLPPGPLKSRLFEMLFVDVPDHD